MEVCGNRKNSWSIRSIFCIEQELSYDIEKDKLMEVRIERTISPNRVVIQFKGDFLKFYSPDKSASLAKIFTEFNCKKGAVASDVGVGEDLESRKKVVHELYSNHKYAIFKTWTWGRLYKDSDSESYPDYDCPLIKIATYSIGIIVSFLPADTEYKVFMCDLGCISTCTDLDMCPIPPGKEFLSENLLYALVTIPGIVPREGMVSIPGAGLETVNFQDSDWGKGAVRDVWNWLSQYKVILLRKLVQESPSLFYGDLYGSKDKGTKMVHKDDLLTAYMTRQAHVSLNFELARSVYDQVMAMD